MIMYNYELIQCAHIWLYTHEVEQSINFAIALHTATLCIACK